MNGNENHGGLVSFAPTQLLNGRGFIHKVWNDRIYPPFLDTVAMQTMRDTWDTDEFDIFICTHQKTGTHLTKKFISQILRTALHYPAGSGMSTGDIGHHTIPWPEVTASQYGMDHFRDFIAKTKGFPRPWYTHCSQDDLPFRSIHPQSKFVFVFRDPRGAAVSQYFFYKSHPMLGVSEDLTIDEYVELFVSGNLYFGDYHQHVLDWIGNKSGRLTPGQLLVLRYEDLVDRKTEAARLLADFILPGNSLSSEQLSVLVAATDFETMKKEITNDPQSFHFNPQKFFRQGKTDGWSTTLNERLTELIDAKSERMWGKGNLQRPFLGNVNTLR